MSNSVYRNTLEESKVTKTPRGTETWDSSIEKKAKYSAKINLELRWTPHYTGKVSKGHSTFPPQMPSALAIGEPHRPCRPWSKYRSCLASTWLHWSREGIYTVLPSTLWDPGHQSILSVLELGDQQSASCSGAQYLLIATSMGPPTNILSHSSRGCSISTPAGPNCSHHPGTRTPAVYCTLRNRWFSNIGRLPPGLRELTCMLSRTWEQLAWGPAPPTLTLTLPTVELASFWGLKTRLLETCCLSSDPALFSGRAALFSHAPQRPDDQLACDLPPPPPQVTLLPPVVEQLYTHVCPSGVWGPTYLGIVAASHLKLLKSSSFAAAEQPHTQMCSSWVMELACPGPTIVTGGPTFSSGRAAVYLCMLPRDLRTTLPRIHYCYQQSCFLQQWSHLAHKYTTPVAWGLVYLGPASVTASDPAPSRIHILITINILQQRPHVRPQN